VPRNPRTDPAAGSEPAPAAADSTGTTPGDGARHRTAAVLRLTGLAPHPANPREDLGDLTELQAPIAEVGVLQPAVVVTVAAHLAAGWPPAAEDATHVVLAGHRRRAARSAAARRRSAAWSAMTWPGPRR
jgi:ParB-like nuclease domain